jgi:hypothetical protein
MKNITSWAFLLALAATAPVMGQEYVIPADTSTNGATCGAPPFAVVAQSTGYVSCGRSGYFPWIAVGGGWTTAFTLSNPTGSDMAVQISLLNTNGGASSGLTMTRNGTSLGVQSSDAQTLPKYGSLRYTLPSGGAASETNGEVVLQVLAKDGLSLQSVQATEDYTYTSAAGIVYSTVSLPISWLDQAQTTYTATFEESSADSSLGAFAIMDASGAGQTVDAKAYDVNGNLLIDKTVTLTAAQVTANTSDGLFGASTFQSLSPSPIARVEFTGAGKLNVLILQVRGQSLAAMPANAVLTQ